MQSHDHLEIHYFELLQEDVPIPWKSILTSAPVWGIMFGNLASDWGLYTILICLPMFLLDILHFDIQTVSVFYPLPGLVNERGVTKEKLKKSPFSFQLRKTDSMTKE